MDQHLHRRILKQEDSRNNENSPPKEEEQWVNPHSVLPRLNYVLVGVHSVELFDVLCTLENSCLLVKES